MRKQWSACQMANRVLHSWSTKCAGQTLSVPQAWRTPNWLRHSPRLANAAPGLVSRERAALEALGERHRLARLLPACRDYARVLGVCIGVIRVWSPDERPVAGLSSLQVAMRQPINSPPGIRFHCAMRCHEFPRYRDNLCLAPREPTTAQEALEVDAGLDLVSRRHFIPPLVNSAIPPYFNFVDAEKVRGNRYSKTAPRLLPPPTLIPSPACA